VRAWSATRPNRLRGVLTLFAPTRPAVRSAKLILTLTTRSSHQPARRYKRHPARLARCAYSPTIPLVALLALRFTCLTPSARPYYVPRCSLLLVLAPSTEIDATRGSRVQSATGNRACSIVFSLSLSFTLPPLLLVARCIARVFELRRGREKRGLFIAKISVYRSGRFREERKREIRWDKMRADIVTIFHHQIHRRCASSERS